MAASNTGWILSLIGGILQIIGTAIYAILGLVATIAGGAAGLIFLIPALIWLVIGILTIVYGKKMKDPATVKGGAIAVLVFSILSGNVLALIGAILGLVEAGK